MDNFTTNNYEMKRDIINFSKKICEGASKPESKFTMDMIYGISKSKDILLSSIAGALDEDTKKAYTIDRLSDNLSNDLSSSIYENYCNLAMDSLGENPVFLIDDSDIIKPLGEKFEDLGIVRDGSSRNKAYEKGYYHTEIVGLTKNKKQPISLFSKIHSSTQKEFVSANDITFEGIDKIVNLLNRRNQKGIFVNDRGYDNNLIFNHYFEKKQYFVIRLKENRKVYCNHKWYKITTIRDSHKGKIKMNLLFQGEEKECSVSVIKVQITAKKKWINLVLVYGLGETPMMLASNIPIKSKDDVIKIARCYLDRWRIEEYFKFKKQQFKFEKMLVRTLDSIRTLNMLLSMVIGFIATFSDNQKYGQYLVVFEAAESLRSNDKIVLVYYAVERGFHKIFQYDSQDIKKLYSRENIKSEQCVLPEFSNFNCFIN